MKTAIVMIQLTLMDLFLSMGIGVLLIGWGAILYAKMASRLSRLESAVGDLKDQVQSGRREGLHDIGMLESRFDLMSAEISDMRAALRENLKTIQAILSKHEDRLGRYDENIRKFWEEYDIRKKSK